MNGEPPVSFVSGRLTSPSDGSEVNRKEEVTGVVAGLRFDARALIIHQSPRSGDYWPQAELRPDREGRFRCGATFGRNDEDAGKDFILMLVSAEQATSASLRDSLEATPCPACHLMRGYSTRQE